MSTPFLPAALCHVKVSSIKKTFFKIISLPFPYSLSYNYWQKDNLIPNIRFRFLVKTRYLYPNVYKTYLALLSVQYITEKNLFH